MIRLWRMLGHIGMLGILGLSVVPGSDRPHTGAGGLNEHLVAYAMVGAAYGLGYLKTRQRVWVGVMMSLAAGLLELVQIFIPGRNPEVEGFAISALGAWVGLALAAAFVAAWQMFRRKPQQ